MKLRAIFLAFPVTVLCIPSADAASVVARVDKCSQMLSSRQGDRSVAGLDGESREGCSIGNMDGVDEAVSLVQPLKISQEEKRSASSWRQLVGGWNRKQTY